jgi:hypothetical protein
MHPFKESISITLGYMYTIVPSPPQSKYRIFYYSRDSAGPLHDQHPSLIPALGKLWSDYCPIVRISCKWNHIYIYIYMHICMSLNIVFKFQNQLLPICVCLYLSSKNDMDSIKEFKMKRFHPNLFFIFNQSYF